MVLNLNVLNERPSFADSLVQEERVVLIFDPDEQVDHGAERKPERHRENNNGDIEDVLDRLLCLRVVHSSSELSVGGEEDRRSMHSWEACVTCC